MEDKEMAIYLLSAAKAAIVTTIDKHAAPQTRAMFNLRNKEQWPKLEPFFAKHEDFMVIFTTNTSSAKIEDIRRNSAVSVYYAIPEESMGLMLGGQMEIVQDPELKKAIWHDGWERYYPSGYNDPDHTVLRLLPTIARGWNQNHTYSFEIGERR
ncbi:MAG: pyridoxamine 5'-phosphate oxidase family protein [Candidatus Thorarchaeota archaeon]